MLQAFDLIDLRDTSDDHVSITGYCVGAAAAGPNRLRALDRQN
jgi:hypothetical protein